MGSGEVSLCIFLGAHCKPLSCDAKCNATAAIHSHIGLVFLASDSLFLMMLILCSAVTSLDAILGVGASSVSSLSVRAVSLIHVALTAHMWLAASIARGMYF